MKYPIAQQHQSECTEKYQAIIKTVTFKTNKYKWNEIHQATIKIVHTHSLMLADSIGHSII